MMKNPQKIFPKQNTLIKKNSISISCNVGRGLRWKTRCRIKLRRKLRRKNALKWTCIKTYLRWRNGSVRWANICRNWSWINVWNEQLNTCDNAQRWVITNLSQRWDKFKNIIISKMMLLQSKKLNSWTISSKISQEQVIIEFPIQMAFMLTQEYNKGKTLMQEKMITLCSSLCLNLLLMNKPSCHQSINWYQDCMI